MSVSVCLSLCLSVRDHIFATARPIFTKFLCMLPVAVAPSFSGGVMIRNVLPVLRMTSYLLTSRPSAEAQWTRLTINVRSNTSCSPTDARDYLSGA